MIRRIGLAPDFTVVGVAKRSFGLSLSSGRNRGNVRRRFAINGNITL
jgi:hypothetical protein